MTYTIFFKTKDGKKYVNILHPSKLDRTDRLNIIKKVEGLKEIVSCNFQRLAFEIDETEEDIITDRLLKAIEKTKEL